MTADRARSRSSVERCAGGLLLFAVAYLPLEEFALKWASGGAASYVALRLLFEGLLYAALGLVAAARVVRGLALPRTPIDGPLLAFAGLALASLALSQGAWLAGLVNLRVLLRYVAVFYLVVYLELGASARRRLLIGLLVAAALQGSLGLLQHLQGGASAFWLPRAGRLEVGGVAREFAAASGLEQGAVLGTTDHSVAFALFLMVAGVLAGALFLVRATSGRRGDALLLGMLALAFLGILASYVRSCLFALVLALVVLAWLERRGRLRALLAPLGGLALVAGVALVAWPGRGAAAGFAREKETRVDPVASVAALFTREYVETARSARLWVLGEVGGEIARSAGWLGFGPDPEHVRRELLRSGGATLHRLIAYRAFEDVYWVALLAYYGFLGLALFLLVLARLVAPARRAWSRGADPWERAAGAALLALLVVTVPLSFLAPTFDFRTFAFAFWLLAGLVAGARPAAASARLGREPVRGAA